MKNTLQEIARRTCGRDNILNGDAIRIGNFDQGDVFNSSSISSFEFADGSTLTTAELLARGFDMVDAANDSEWSAAA